VAAATRTDPNWHGVELRHLIALRAVAAEQSFSAAARALGYTQSAVSGQVLALERLIGARLFVRVRGTRPLELTEEGRILLGHASAILDRLQAAQLEISAANDPPPRLRIGSFWNVGGAFLPAICRRLGESTLPQLEIVEDTGVDSLLDGVARKKLDVAFTSLPVREGPFQSLSLCRDPYVVVVRRNERIGQLLTLDELMSLPLLMLKGCHAQEAFELVLQSHGRPLDIRGRFDTIASVLAFVSDGFGAGLLPSLALDLPPSLVAVQLDPRIPSRLLGLVWHRDQPLAGLTRQFVDAALDVAAGCERPLQAVS
jgi:DNA-binding transcriptional LysR family regulator